jgi:hypothetical protein
MKLTLATIASVLVCLFSLAARSVALRAAAQASPERAYAEQERLALEAIDGSLRARLRRLARR